MELMSLMHWLIVLIIVVPFYFIPSIVAIIKSHKHMPYILMTNTFLGWTCVGWILALAWTLSPKGGRVQSQSHG